MLVNPVLDHIPDLRVIPPSWVLPHDAEVFSRVRLATQLTYIMKPDRGSLGQGITLLRSGDAFEANERLVVAQEYVEPYLLDGRKFDLRIYALISSVKPLEIYVHRDGVVRFCTELHSETSRFGFLTNTAVNTRNSQAAEGSMTKTTGELWEILRERGVDTDRVWRDIEHVLVLALLSGLNFLERYDLPTPYGISRCYQIFGCDVLLDSQLRPFVLELNYRPNLRANTDGSYSVKLKMLRDTLQLVTPPNSMQEWLAQNMTEPFEPPADIRRLARRRRIRHDNGYHRVFPNHRVPLLQRVADFVRALPTELSVAGRLPMPIGSQEGWGEELGGESVDREEGPN
jgi:hypothetical protein